MRSKSKQQLSKAVVGVVLLWAVLAKAKASGNVLVGPVTVTTGPKLTFDKATEALVQRYTLALARSRQLLGADPNTLVSRQPTASELPFIESTLSLGKSLSASTKGAIPLPTELERMLALGRRLPGDTLQQANAALYQALGVDPRGDNEATLPLSPARDQLARSVISKWRPYSQDAVDTLFVLLDQSRELAVGVS